MPRLKVTRIDAVTPRVRRIELENADGGELPAFTAGAHIDVDLGMGEARSYSLLNDATERNRYVLGVLREEVGLGGSAWVHEQLKVGDVLTSTLPSNDFPLMKRASITSSSQVASASRQSWRWLRGSHRSVMNTRCTIAHGRQAKRRFWGELTERHGAHLKTHFDGGDPSIGIDLKSLLAVRPPAGHVYVCGPTGLIRAVREAAKDWPIGMVHYELFKGSASDTDPVSNDQPFEIVLKRTNRTFTVPADKTILQVLRAEGVKVKTLCTRGTCGTCRVGLISGKVDHRDEVLDDDEKESFLQVCVSRAMPGETLVLDL